MLVLNWGQPKNFCRMITELVTDLVTNSLGSVFTSGGKITSGGIF